MSLSEARCWPLDRAVSVALPGLDPTSSRVESTITAVRPVIEQGISDILKKNPNASGQDLERKIAQRLTELNDWKNLTKETKEKMKILSGVDIDKLNGRVREDVVNHLLHSPLPSAM